MKFNLDIKFCTGCGVKLDIGPITAYDSATGFPSHTVVKCPNYRRGWFNSPDGNGCTNGIAHVVAIKSRKKK